MRLSLKQLFSAAVARKGFIQNGGFKSFVKFTERPCALIKLLEAKFCKVFKNIAFVRLLRMTVSLFLRVPHVTATFVTSKHVRSC